MSAQRLDGHGSLTASCPDNCLKIHLIIIISGVNSTFITLHLRILNWIPNIFLFFYLCTLNQRREHAQESHATSRRWSFTFLPNFFCPLTFEGPAVRSPLFTKTNPTKSKYFISKKETKQYPHASLCQMLAWDKQQNLFKGCFP